MLSSLSRFAIVARFASDDDQRSEAMSCIRRVGNSARSPAGAFWPPMRLPGRYGGRGVDPVLRRTRSSTGRSSGEASGASRRSGASYWDCCDFAPFDPRKTGVCFFASRARSEACPYPRASAAAGLPPPIARYLHSLSGGTANSREKSEKLHAYTNLTRLKSFVNLQLDLDPLHYSSLFLFALGEERTRF